MKHVLPVPVLVFACTAGGGTTIDPIPLDPRIEATPLVCEEPRGPEDPPWTRTVLGEDWRFAPDYHTPAWDLRRGGRGVIVADLDGDGILDLVVPQELEPTRVLLGVGDGTFAQGTMLPEEDGVRGAIGGSAADFDADGDTDVFLYGLVDTAVMLVNRGDATFDAVPHPEWDDPTFPGCGGSASWADFDLDGDLDLFYGRLGKAQGEVYTSCAKRMLVNAGGGVFLDESDRWLGADVQELRVLASGWHQFDDDPWPELYLVADAVMENLDSGGAAPTIGSDLLYDNDADGLRRKEVPSLELAIAGMGLAAGDLQPDGLVDLMIPDVDRLFVLVGVSGDVWIDYAAAWGLTPEPSIGQSVAWGGEWADLDADGLQDLLVTYGAIPGGSKEQPDEVHRALGAEGPFERVGAAWGWDDPEPTRGFVVADLNGDGWLDVVKRELGGVVMVDTSRCGAAATLVVSLRGEAGNPQAVGAKVRIEAGGVEQVRFVTAGSTSFASGGPAEVHFGLGDVEVVDELEVTWPDGGVSSYGAVEARQRLVVGR